jgi:hypothetical protein
MDSTHWFHHPGKTLPALLLGAGLMTASAMGATPHAEDRTRFGFTGPEAFPLDNFIGQLKAADVDGDGLTDLVVANNQKARINILINRTGKPPLPPAAGSGSRGDVNELPPDSRFKVESLTSEKRIAALELADVNGDGLPDVIYFGEPKPVELVVHYNQGHMNWSPPKRWQIEDAQLTPSALAVGDLNGDGLADVVVMGENQVAFLAQKPDHTLAEPEKIPFTGSVKAVDILDVNGDGRKDLVLVNGESPNPIRFRLQNAAGQLGPEIHFAQSPIRAFLAEDLEGDGRTEVITIAQSSGRAQIANLGHKPAPPLAGTLLQGQFQVMPLLHSSRSQRGMAWADVDGDGLADLLVAQPDTGQLTLFLQSRDGSMTAARTFPCLAGVTDIALGATSGGARPDIYLLSSDERQVGWTSFTPEGRMPFPTPLRIEGKPLAIATGSLQQGKPPVIAAITEVEDRRQLVVGTRASGFKSQKLSAAFKSNPSGLVFHDVNQDGLADIVVLIPYEKLKILLQVPGHDFEEVDVAPPGGNSEHPWASAADVDGDGKPELLLAQKNFLRAVVLTKADGAATADAAWGLTVKDQLNGAEANSRIVAAAPLRNGTNTVDSLFLLDAERKAVTLCERDRGGVWQPIRNIALPFAEFSELRPVGLGSTTPNAIAFLGASGVGWMSLAGEVWELTELDGYESQVKDGRLTDVVAGDLNQDGRKDLVFLETGRNHLELVILSKAGKLTPAVRWQVFEERTFRSRRGELPEPREALVADLNNDGKRDLAIVVHDRVLVYLQQ